jgi:hypothetical protein
MKITSLDQGSDGGHGGDNGDGGSFIDKVREFFSGDLPGEWYADHPGVTVDRDPGYGGDMPEAAPPNIADNPSFASNALKRAFEHIKNIF